MTAAPAIDFIEISRVRSGEVVRGALQVAFDGAVLTIGEGWSVRLQDIGRTDTYRVTELPTAAPGRLFRLERDPAKVERARRKGGDDSPHYSVLIGPTPACDCRGHTAACERGMKCKHLAAVKWAIEEGHLD